MSQRQRYDDCWVGLSVCQSVYLLNKALPLLSKLFHRPSALLSYPPFISFLPCLWWRDRGKLRQFSERAVGCFFFTTLQKLRLSSKRQPLRVHPLSSGVWCFYYYLNYQLVNRLLTAEDSPEEEAPSSNKILELNSNTFDSLSLTDTSLPSKRFRLGYCAKVAATALVLTFSTNSCGNVFYTG